MENRAHGTATEEGLAGAATDGDAEVLDSMPARWSGIRMSSAEGSGRGSILRERWRCSRSLWCWMSR